MIDSGLEGRQVVDVHVGVADERCECGSRGRWRPGRHEDFGVRQCDVTRNNSCAGPADCAHSGNVSLAADLRNSFFTPEHS